MRRTLRGQLLWTAGLGAGVGGLLALGTLFLLLGVASRQRLSDVRTLVAPDAVARCEADPASFREESGVVRIWAYDAQGRSANPRAPVLPAALRSPEAEQATRASLPDGPWWRVGASQRVAAEGPCAVWFAEPADRRPMVPSLGGAATVAWLVGIGAALWITLGTAVAPVVRRLDQVDAVARRVGTDAYEPLNDATPDALGRVTATLDRAHARIVNDRAELTRRHELLEAHLAGLAHDLRTPLTALQLALEPLDGAGPARREVAYLVQLANNLHEASRLQGGLDVRVGGPVELGSVVRRIGVRFAILGRALETEVVTATPDEPCWAACAPALAERALANLVHNAVVHGGSRVGWLLETTARGFRVTVQDDGEALDPEVVAGWASRRLPVADGDGGRRGLGLAIVGEVVDRAGWSIRYEPMPEGGLRVQIDGECMEPAQVERSGA